MLLVHMVGREEPGLFPLRPDQTRIGLEIQHGDFFGSRQTEQRSLYGHKKSKPFFVARMTEYGKLRLVRPRMLRLCAVSILYIVYPVGGCHGSLTSAATVSRHGGRDGQTSWRGPA